MNTEEAKKGFGLLPLPEDSRDLSLGTVFGIPNLDEIPNIDFTVATPLVIKDQKRLDFCSLFAGTAVSEDQEGVELSPEYSFAKAKQLLGEWQSWGVDLRTACKALTKFGSIPQAIAPFSVNDKDRDFLANWENWPIELDRKASEHKKETFWAVTGPYDFFDNIRASLWKHRYDKCTVLAGTMWFGGWTVTENGVVSASTENLVLQEPHALKFFGQKIINGTPYLKAQNSWSEKYGDRGIFYFPREIVNQYSPQFGSFMFKDDMPIDEAKILNEYGLSVQLRVIAQILLNITKAVQKLKEIMDTETKLINATIDVESEGINGLIGDKGLAQKAYGLLQITQDCLTDANEYLGTKHTLQEVRWGKEISIKIYKAYMARYANEKRIGRAVTNEDKARIWNGGPNGWIKPQSKPEKERNLQVYWGKIQVALSRQKVGFSRFLGSNLTMENQLSPKGKLFGAEIKRILIGAGVAMVGALLTYLQDKIPAVDFGSYTPIVVAINSVIVNTVRKLLTDYSIKG